MIVEINPYHPQPRRIKQVVDRLLKGELVAYPTDTVYAIGCLTSKPKAVRQIHRLKATKRGLDSQPGGTRPLSIIVPDLSAISEWALVGNQAHRLMKRLAPGPYTFVLEATRKVPRVMLTRQKTIGVRIPDSPVTRALTEAIGEPLITTSATGLDGELLTSPYDIERDYKGSISVVLDAGAIFPEPSSVIDLRDNEVQIIREGKGDLTSIL